MALCEGRVAIVTGAGRGVGRAHALMLARHGAKVVVNDLGGSKDGKGQDLTPAQEVVEEIIAGGGEAIANAL
jgi:NAD(P)-dependent dehydrogenase (short-subunit alcohol dehydrogenase family)